MFKQIHLYKHLSTPISVPPYNFLIFTLWITCGQLVDLKNALIYQSVNLPIILNNKQINNLARE